MKSTNYIIIFMISIFLISCDYEQNSFFDESSYTLSKIYKYNLSDSTIVLIDEGTNPLLLPKTKKIVFLKYDRLVMSYELELYDYSADIFKSLYDSLIYYNSNSVSEDEEYLLFSKNNSINKLSLNTGNIPEVLKVEKTLKDNFIPVFSNNYRYFGFITSTKINENNKEAYLLTANIYNRETYLLNSITDSVIIPNLHSTAFHFTNNSEYFYIQTIAEPFYYVNLFVYEDVSNPKFLVKKRVGADYGANLLDINEDDVLIISEHNTALYTIHRGALGFEDGFKKYRGNLHKVKYSDYLIGLQGSTVGIINLLGSVEKEIEIDTDEQISWADFDIKNNLIFFQTTQTITEQGY